MITPWDAVAEVMVVTGVNSVSSPRPAEVPFLYESHSPSVDIKDNRVTRALTPRALLPMRPPLW